MAEDDIKISICDTCFAVDEANYHYCKHCGTPSKYRKRLDRRNEKRRKAKSSTATIILSTTDENEAFIAKAVELGFYEYVND